jgi:glucose/arabinose dehydrogenase
MGLLRNEAVLWLGTAVLAAAAIAGAVGVVLVGRRHPAGEATFRQRCAVCHSTDARAAQGPGLGGIVGRAAGTAPGFGYTHALRQSGIVWDKTSLDRFLSNPAALVPGTTMPINVPDRGDRQALVAYLVALSPGPVANAAADAPPSSNAGPFADYRSDAPGRRHRIVIADLPAPYASPSVRNSPSVVDPPDGAMPQVPAGFRVSAFANGLESPRLVRVAPNGDAFVAESSAGRIRVLRSSDGSPSPDRVDVFADRLTRPFGIAFYPPGDDPLWVYVASVGSVVRFPYRRGDLHARGPAETIVPRLTEQEGGHWTRDIAFSLDGKTMYVSIGSGSNVAEGVSTRTPSENAAWDKAHGIGAEWGDELNRADVLAFDPEGHDGRVFATGIRNCVGMAMASTGDLWCATNERDGLGDNLVPDYVTRVAAQSFFGWPWYYLGGHEDPRHAGERPDLRDHVAVPDVLLQPHSAPLQMAFYDGAMFPDEYRGDAFVACHGSWNRAARTGPKVVRVVMRDGRATGDYEDFMTGFVVDSEHVWGRPVGVAVAHDGALLVTEDGNGTLWRVSSR